MPLIRRFLLLIPVLVTLTSVGLASAYNASPKLVVIIIVDQLRADLLQRHYDKFGPNGFRLLMDRGAYFSVCYYDYLNLHTAPGHATISTGAYSDAHGILGNRWWAPQLRKRVDTVYDGDARTVGIESSGPSVSPRVLGAGTFADELKMATAGKARAFGVALKDRSALLPAGRGGMAYWIDGKSGAFVTSTYYTQQLPKWVQDFNATDSAEKYFGREWKDAAGKVHRTIMGISNGGPDFYSSVGGSPYGNDYTLEFARKLIANEKVGTGPATDLLAVSLSSNDIVGHAYGPDSPEVEAMTVATDRQLAEFFSFLDRRVGLANVWIALTADHGVAPTRPETERRLRTSAADLLVDEESARQAINTALSSKIGKGTANYVPLIYERVLYLDEQAFNSVGIVRADAERMVAETAMQQGIAAKLKIHAAYGHSQIMEGHTPAGQLGKMLANSGSRSYPGWYVLTVQQPLSIPSQSGTDHGASWSYDTHVPLAFFGIPFRAGTYRTHSEPVDLVVTFSSLLGINKPTHAVGRVLTEALAAEPSRTQRAQTTPKR